MIRIKCKLNSVYVIDVLSDQRILRGLPKDIRSNNGPEFTDENVRKWTNAVGSQSAYVEAGSTWENGYIESFSGKNAR